MGIGSVISGSQLLQGSDNREFTTVARDRSAKNIQENNQQKTSTAQIQHQAKVQTDVEKEKKQIEGMVGALNDFLEPMHTSIKFEMHDKLDKYYVTVVDSSTNEIVKEIPPKKMLDVYAAMAEFMGFIVDEKI